MRTPRCTTPCCTIVPPHLLEALTRHADTTVAERARHSLLLDGGIRQHRAAVNAEERGVAPAPLRGPSQLSGPQRVVSDAEGGTELPGVPVRREGEDPTGDPAADEAYDGLGATHTLFRDVFQRDGIDGAGGTLLATVHYGRHYDNAFWDGRQMVFGDGDGTIFQRFTLALDVIGHELSHGVIEATAALVYQGQSGALNESIADVLGSLVRQYQLGQDAAEADWLIGAGLFTDAVEGAALRSMKDPGTAYDDDVLGRDPQVGHMRDFIVTTRDNGGVHLNSGIPNRAFYLAATAIGGPAWQAAGQIWFSVLTGPHVTPDCDFATFARLTVAAAAEQFGAGSPEAEAVSRAWQEVGVLETDEHEGSEGRPAGHAVPHSPAGPPVEAPVHVRVVRSGGLLGRSTESEVDLSTLDDAEATAWFAVLRSASAYDAHAAPAEPAQPDRYVYQVISPELGIDVTAPEQLIPPEVRSVLDRTLRR